MKKINRHLLPFLLFIFCLSLATMTAADNRTIRRNPSSAESSDARVALVIGNSDYQTSPLKNPVNDAQVMSNTLKDVGFDVIERQNLDFQAMNMVIDEFGNRLKRGGVGLFYFAGHGVQSNGKNYLVPVKSNIQHENEIKYRAVDANLVLAKMESAGSRLNIVILDACRNNPFARSFRTTASGLALMEGPTGSIIAYATSPGKTAGDGPGKNGVYTSELVREMKKPNQRLIDMFMNVRRSVKAKTNNRQIPWETQSLVEPFVLRPDKTPDDQSRIVADSGAAIIEEQKKEMTLTVDCSPSSASVWIDGKNYGNTRKFKMPKAGTYIVKVEADGYKTYNDRVRMQNGKALTIKAYLEKIEAPAAQIVPVPPAPTERRAGDTWTEPTTGMEFVWVPGDCFQMGCGSWTDNCNDDEKPVHEVCVDGFWMGKYEVTVKQYMQFVRETRSNEPEWLEQGSDYNIKTGSDNHYKKMGNALTAEDHPIVGVSWHNGQAFAKWLTQKGHGRFRLPTEAEWEYAARSGGKNEKYAGSGNIDSVAWYSSNSNNRTHKVGTKSPNGLGIYDMSGNVWEWCKDRYDKEYYSKSPERNPEGASSGSARVRRGGGWGNSASFCRSAYRSYDAPGYRNRNLGLRLLRIEP